MEKSSTNAFNSDIEERFINIIQQNAILFDVSNVSYKNNILRQTIWKNIENELGIPSKILQSKWKNIRYRYAKRLKSRKKSDTNCTVFQKKTVRYDLSFLDKFLNENEDTNKIANDTKLENYNIQVCSSEDEEENYEEEDYESTKNDPLDTSTSAHLQKRNETVITHLKDHERDSEELYCLSLAEPLRCMERKERERVKYEIAKIFKDAVYTK